MTAVRKRVSKYATDYLFVLGPAHRRLPAVLALVIVAVLLDLLGVGLVVGLITMILSEATPPPLLGLTAQPRIAFLLIGSALIAVFVAKAWLSYATQERIVRFSDEHRAELIERLMAAYQAQDWRYHLTHSSSVLVNRVLWHTYSYSTGTLAPSLRLAADSLVLAILGLLLTIADPGAFAFLLFFLGITLLIIHERIRRSLSNAQSRMAEANQRLITSVTAGLGALREIRVFGHEAHFRQEVAGVAREFARNAARHGSLSHIPRYAIEAALVAIIVVLASYRFVVHGSAVGLVPTLATFTAAGLRMLPAATSWLHSLNSLRATRGALAELAAELTVLHPPLQPESHDRGRQPSSGPADPFKELRIEDLHFAYDASLRSVISGFSLSILAGESVGVMGPSGSGKSTLADLLLGFLEPDSGRVVVNGRDIREHNRYWLDRVAYIPQSAYVLDGTIRSNIVFGEPLAEIDSARLERAIDMAQLRSVVTRLPNGLDSSVGENGNRLSGGERQRLALARAIYHNREFIILDEATAALDGTTESDIVRAIHGLHGTKTLMIIAHREATLKYCDRVIRLAEHAGVEHVDSR